MAQLDRRECVPTFSDFTPNVASPIACTVDLMNALVCDDVIITSLFVFGFKNVLTCDVSEASLYDKTLLMVLAQSRTGHKIPVFALCCVIVSIFSPFF